MTSPGSEVARATLRGSAEPITPTAVASAKSASVHQFGQVLHTVVRNSRAFHNENDEDNAHRAIDAFVNAHVPGSEMSALMTGNEHAPKEDVSLRIPPGGAVAVPAFAGLDYQALAKAILAEQARQTAPPEVGNEE